MEHLPEPEQDRLVNFWILRDVKPLFQKWAKNPLRKAIVLIGKRYPEPTKKNTVIHNAHILIDIRDKFFECYTNKERIDMFKAGWKIFIDEYEHEPEYRYIFDWLLEEITKSDWKPRPPGRPRNWREGNK